MINVQDAVKNAEESLHELIGEHIGAITLEEVELADDESHWLITFGYNDRPVLSVTDALMPGRNRRYKIFKVDAATGKVKSMKIRPVPNA